MKMKRVTMAAVAVALVTAAPAIALADPVTWRLSNVTFDDGGTASGSFVFDATTYTYSEINITTSGGAFTPSTYVAVQPAPLSDEISIVAVTGAGAGPGAPVISFLYEDMLTNAGGVVQLAPVSGEGQCGGPSCAVFSSDPTRAVVSGYVTTVQPVPTLSEWAMILLGVLLASSAALMIQRRRVHI